ncbi:response regulator transcription factor [Periweissella cryptocerci]|uniref:Response regulator transcription factor n=1 Tax=Periweissella cryptocerci TaxID=2506420 RepID=A0A4P6YTZ0_9LACO|nr:LytTR family DNA-binding domain-containing protein [Periweissella cryptocerci]QBO36171.1 response regulator transcription factor [Periweissella cryptocerci]
MVDIFLCEDNPQLSKIYLQYIRNKVLIEAYDADVTCNTNTPYDVIEYLQNNVVSGGIYFLDIEYDDVEINGIDLAVRVRELDSQAFIVFITSHDELVMTALEARVEILDYIIKSMGQEMIQRRIGDDLGAAVTRHMIVAHETQQQFIYFINSIQYSANIDRFFYLETDYGDHKLLLHLQDEVVQINGDLKLFLADNEFLVQVQRGIVVNKEKIKRFDAKEKVLYLSDNINVPASKHYMKLI